MHSHKRQDCKQCEARPMAQVRLWIDWRDDAIYDLPRVCMKCGARATTAKKTQFAWYPPWLLLLILAGILPFLIAVVILTKRQRVEVPFCDEHKYHFVLRRVFQGLGWLGFLGAPVLFFIGAAADQKGGGLAPLLCLGWLGLILLYFVGIRVFAILTKIRPSEITERDITLTNVSPEFSRAVAEDDAPEEDDDRERRKEDWRRDRRVNDDRYKPGDERPRPRRSTDITEGESE
jgi:hypothetical protein